MFVQIEEFVLMGFVAVLLAYESFATVVIRRGGSSQRSDSDGHDDRRRSTRIARIRAERTWAHRRT